MNHDELKMIAKKKLIDGEIESDCLEYKKSNLQKDKILKTICAFANNLMNRKICLIILGVDENDDENGKGTPKRPIDGFDAKNIETIENSVKSLIPYITPKVDFDITNSEIDNKKFVVIGIKPQHSSSPFAVTDKAYTEKSIKLKPGRYVRIERDSILANPRQEIELIKKYSNYHFSEETNDKATIDDLDVDYIREYLSKECKDYKTFSGLNKKELCQTLGLIDETSDNKPFNWAVLMFSKNPENFIPESYIEIIQNVDESDNVKNKKITGPIWKQNIYALDYIENEILKSFNQRVDDEPTSRDINNYPYAACEELVTNAIVHKDYSIPRAIQIYEYKDCIVITNYNRPLLPVTIQDLNTLERFPERNYENPTIRIMFKNLHLIESYGSGVGRAKKSMKRNGSPDLNFQDKETDMTSVYLPINREFYDLNKKILGNNLDFDEEKIDIESKKIDIQEILRKSNYSINIRNNISLLYEKLADVVFSRKDILDVIGGAASTASLYVEKMFKLNLIHEVHGLGKGKYKFN